jgi:DNA-binding GntR family transcriptional regulator
MAKEPLSPNALLSEFRHIGTTADAVYEVLRHWIISGDLPPGEKLRGETLAQKIRVSRTPVRDALRKLEVEGLVTSSAHGLMVAELREQDLTEIFQLREALEGAAARFAAENATRLEIEKLHELMNEMEAACSRGDIEAMRSLAAEYHDVICSASRNERMRQLLRALRDRTRQFQTSVFGVPGHPAQVLADYRTLLQAIEARDGDRAEQVARQHRGKSLVLRKRLLREQIRQVRKAKIVRST